MARRKPCIEETLAWPILQEMIEFAKGEQVIANERAFYSYVLKDKYPDMTLGQYRYHFGELLKSGFISIESKTRAVRVRDLIIVERDSF